MLIVWKLDRLGRSLAAPDRNRDGAREARCRLPLDHRGDRHHHARRPAGVPPVRRARAVRARPDPGTHPRWALSAAAARGRKGGRKPVVDADKLARARSMVAKGLTVREAATRLKVGKTALYEALRLAAAREYATRCFQRLKRGRLHRQRGRHRSRNRGPERSIVRARPGTVGARRPIECARTCANQGHQTIQRPPRLAARVTTASPTAEKIALFRSLFRGREEVFPRRWENAQSGKSGYSPVCRNEWVRGVCGKPQVKCGECPNQAFVPFGDDVLRSHLTGKAAGNSVDFTAGIYPMLPDETCWFLAADFDKKSWKQDVARVPRYRAGERCPRRDRTIALGQRCSCMDLLRGTCCGG